MRNNIKYDNELQDRINQRRTTQKKTLYFLVFISCITFLSLQLMNIQTLTNFNYTFHEMLGIPVTIGFYLIPIVMVIYIIQLIRYIRVIGMNALKAIPTIKICIALLSIFFIMNTLYSLQYKNLVSGFVKVEQKIQAENKFFLVLGEDKIEVTKKDYELVTQNKYYEISYTYDTRTKKGKLENVKEETNMDIEGDVTNEEY